MLHANNYNKLASQNGELSKLDPATKKAEKKTTSAGAQDQDGEACSMSAVELGMKMHERDRKRATELFRTHSLSKTSLDLAEPNAAQLGSFEPDWTKFENVFASELLPHAVCGEVINNLQKLSTAKKERDLVPYAPTRHVQTSQFLLEIVNILLDYIRKTNDRTTKVLDFHHPSTLREMMGHCIDLPNEPQNLEQILSDCKETLKYCVKTGHPRFFNQLSTGLDMIALAGEWLTATANTNMFTYEIAPVFTLMEDIVLNKMRELVGWSAGDGIFAPGGAISNLYAVAVARQKYMPEVKQKGLVGMPRLVMFTSEHAHFSIKRAGVLLGIGLDNVILISTDERGHMRTDELDEKITAVRAAGGVPFFVSCTTGTTVFGAFDPVDALADVCEKHNVWLHVDGAWGGSALLSSRTRGLLHGVHRADSLTWNPHKLMGALLQCSAILLKEKGLLEACNSLRASYLFQQDKHYDISYDTGDKAIQCGRHNDIFKLWLLWRAKGDIGFEQHINRLIDLSRYFQRKITGRDGFEYVLENPEFINTCFWYVPKSLRHMPPGKDRNDALHKVAPRIKARMMESGNTMVGYQPIDDKPNFFRMIISNPAATESDIDFLISEIERLGEEE